MPIPPDPTDLYPDVAASGSLADALRAAARDRLDGVPVSSGNPRADRRSGAPFMHLTGRFEVPERDPVRLSHWVLRFSTTTRPRLTDVGPCLTAGGDGTFGVGRGHLTPDLGRFATAREAVAVALRHLPADLGPPVALGG